MGIKVLSLFDGMACGMIAMQNAGVDIERYVAYEIDKYAVKTSSHNFPEIEHRGDVFVADFKEFEGFDYVIGGSPCSHWSICQTHNRETTASGIGWDLFCQYIRCINDVRPRYFIYENNKSMSNAIRQSICGVFGFEPIGINSKLVSAQNRERLYWVGKRNTDGSYSAVDVNQPEDRGIMLRSVLEVGAEIDETVYTLSEREMDYMVRTVKDGRNHFDFQYFHDGNKDKSACLTANIHKGVPYNVLAQPIRIGTIENTAKTPQFDSKQYRVYSPDGKAVTLCANGGGIGAKTGLYAVPFLRDPTECYQYLSAVDFPVYAVENGLITVNGNRYPIILKDGYYIIRKLTVLECMRLQTVPEWYEFPVSKTQAYKMLGNGWTCDVITHIINEINKGG